MHAMLSQLFAEKGEHEDATIHARRGLDNNPKPLPDLPGFVLTAHKLLSRFFPQLRDAAPDEALERIRGRACQLVWMGKEVFGLV